MVFFQGKSSEFARIPEIPYTMQPLKKSPTFLRRQGKFVGTLIQESLNRALRWGLRVLVLNWAQSCNGKSPKINLVNLFLIKLVRISGFSSLFSAIAVFLALSGKMC